MGEMHLILFRQLYPSPSPRQRPVHQPKEYRHHCRAHDDDIIRHGKVWCGHVHEQPPCIHVSSARLERIRAFGIWRNTLLALHVQQRQNPAWYFDSAFGVRAVLGIFQRELGIWDAYFSGRIRQEAEREM